MGDLVSSGEGRRLEEEVRRIQKKCVYKKERGKNTCLRERKVDHASRGKRG